MEPPAPARLARRIGLWLGLLLLLLTLWVPAPPGLSLAAWRTAGVGLLMAAWWMTVAIPIPATALLPLALFPLLGIRGIGETAAPYANEVIFLFLGGFLIAAGMERWDLPRRVAFRILAVVGSRPAAVVAAFMTVTAFLSMWVSNTATAIIMLPIAASVVALGRTTGQGDARFGAALMLGIAYGASIGGVGTLIGTPPNALLAGFLSETYGVQLGFVQWMAFGLPLVLVGLPVTFLVLTRLVFPLERAPLPGVAEFVRRETAALGPLTRPQRAVGIVFAATAVLWILRPLLGRWLPGLSDVGIAVVGGLALFLIPAGRLADAEGALLRWGDAERIPWGVLILFGGGLSLASAIQATGLTRWIGQATSGLEGLPLALLIAAPVAVIVILTELTSNTATAASFLPILASVAVGIGENPLTLAVPAVVAASCAFMLPVATPPNAIVYGSGAVASSQMARAGAVLNVIFVVLITSLAYLLVPLVFGVQFGAVPHWAGGP